MKHVGAGAGPPDFAGRYDDECVGIEHRRVFPSDGWGVTTEMGFARRLRTVIAEVYGECANGPRWHVCCEYDPLQPCPSVRSIGWQARARRALSTPGPGGTFPSLPGSQQKGYGLELVLTPTRPGGAFGHLPEHEWGLAPPAEAMVFEGFGRAPAAAVFCAAARIAQVQDRVAVALRTHLAGPALLVVVIALMLWAAGMWFVPALEELAPLGQWPVASRAAAEVAVAFRDNVVSIGAAFVVGSGVVGWLARNWVGRGRGVAGGFFPFSIVRLVSGLSFVLTVVEAMRAGLELDARLFRGLASGGTRYTRHRIGAIGELRHDLGGGRGGSGRCPGTASDP